MTGAVHFNPNIGAIGTKYNVEMPSVQREFVTNAVNKGTYNLNHPKTADSEYFKALGMSVSPAANRLDYLC